MIISVNFEYELCHGLTLDVDAVVDCGRGPRYGDSPDPGDDPQLVDVSVAHKGVEVHLDGLADDTAAGRAPITEVVAQRAIAMALDEEADVAHLSSHHRTCGISR